MRSITLTLVAFGLLFLSGCGCLESFGESTGIRYPYPFYPDPNQPAWDRCLFGKKSGIGPGDRNFEWQEPDPSQPGWHQALFGIHLVPRDRYPIGPPESGAGDKVP